MYTIPFRIKMIPVLCSLAFLCLIIFHDNKSYGQSPLKPIWNYRYGGADADGTTSFIHSGDGGYVIAGYSTSGATGDKSQPSQGSFDYWVVKTDSAGIIQFNFRFGGLNEDLLTTILQTVDGGYLLGGYSASGITGDKSENSRGIYDYWIVKTDSSGNKIWDKRFGGNDYDQLYEVLPAAGGGFLLGGWSASGVSGDVTDSSRGDKDYWVVRIDSAGNKLWDKRYGGNADDIFSCMVTSTDGEFLLCGSTASDSSGEKTQNSRGSNDYWIVKIDTAGNKIWDKRFGGSNIDYPTDIKPTFDGNYIIGGWSDSPMDGDRSDSTNGGQDFWIIKIDSSGNKIWDRDFGGIATEDDFGNLFETLDSGIMITGTSYSNISGEKTENNLGIEQGWLIKTDSLGNLLWDKTIFTLGHDESALTIQSPDGCYEVAVPTQSGIGGYKSQDARGFNDYWIIKLCDSTLLPDANFISSDVMICPGTCIEFLNFSVNAISYQWSFPGGIPSSSTDSIPPMICYANPGIYDATLITGNYFSYDTLELQNFITVFPQTAPQSITQINDTLYSNQGFISYQWYFNGSIISGATNYFYFAQVNGDYYVVCHDSNGCELEAAIFDVLTGVGDLSIHHEFQIFPNPAFETLHLEFPSSIINSGSVLVRFLIFDIKGNKVLREEQEIFSQSSNKTQTEMSIDVSMLADGMYWLQTFIGDEVVRNKFIKSSWD